MESGNVVSLNGGPRGVREVNEAVVSVLEKWLEAARSGEVIGVAIALLDYDWCGRWSVAGVVGGYSMLGALEVARADLLEVMRDG